MDEGRPERSVLHDMHPRGILTFNQKVEYIRPMRTSDYTHRFTAQATPEAVHKAIERVTDWWTVNTDGRTTAVGDEFTVQFGDVHLTTQRVVEVVRGERIVWRVIASHLPWLKDVEEWMGTEIVFDIASVPEGTQLTVTHVGLTPRVECHEQCEKGWDLFIGTSLHLLITTGTGQPDTTDRTHMDVIGHVHPKNA